MGAKRAPAVSKGTWAVLAYFSLGREDYLGWEACVALLPGMESRPSPARVAEPPGHSHCLPLHPLGSALPLCPQRSC